MSDGPNIESFLDAIAPEGELRGLEDEGILAAMRPLLQQVIDAHEAGRVAPLDGVTQLLLDGVHLFFHEKDARTPRANERILRRLSRPASEALDVLGQARRTYEVGPGTEATRNLDVGRPGELVERPVYLPGYRSWEHEVGHHDALTDIYVLGLILGSLALGRDLGDLDDLRLFVAHRHNLFRLQPKIHPVIAHTIVRMTELDRHRRAQDLPNILLRLEHRRESFDPEVDFTQIPGFEERERGGRRSLVLDKLEERLYDLSRRNPLLYFKPRAATLDLTAASVPLQFDPRSLRAEDLFTWRPDIHRRVAAGKPLDLGSLLRFREASYLQGTLTKIRAEARRDRREQGFANLRLVLAFLRWNDLKNAPAERIHSPLVLLPVDLVKKKGVKDRWHLIPLDTRAEVNPVLRHQLEQLYGLDLPDFIDLEATDLERFHQFLHEQIQASEQGVTLERIDRPRVQLVYRRARQRLDLYLRRSRGTGHRSYRDLDYSYRRENFQPLGLRLFQSRVRPTAVSFEEILNEARRFPIRGQAPVEKAGPGPTGRVKERLFAEFAGEQVTDNPYTWEFDLTHLTLGNFRYRKMALVRDYKTLRGSSESHTVFDTLFSLDPRPVDPEPPRLALEDRYPVVACDPTQTRAIAAARDGRSYIIQGPPGTGKSQTITNLIADFVARGQRVLFVCQKRAALDVVYLRLKKLGLDRLCGLVHDAQADKKGVIHDLRRAYETRHELSMEGQTTGVASRQRLLGRLQRSLNPLDEFRQAMHGPVVGEAPPDQDRIWPFWKLLHRRVEIDAHLPDLDVRDRSHLPTADLWFGAQRPLRRLEDLLVDLQPDGIFSHHPLACLNPELSAENHPLEAFEDLLDRAGEALESLLDALRETPLPPGLDTEPTLQEVGAWILLARHLEPLAQRGFLELMVEGSAANTELDRQRAERKTLQNAVADLRRENQNWRELWSAEDTEAALSQARQFDRQPWSILLPSRWRLRKLLLAAYDFEAHRLPPTWVAVLEKKQAEHVAIQRLVDADEAARQHFGWPGGVPGVDKALSQIHAALESSRPATRDLLAKLLDAQWFDDDRGARFLRHLVSVDPIRQSLEEALHRLLADPFEDHLVRLSEILEGLGQQVETLDDFLPVLEVSSELPPEIPATLRRHPWTLQNLEAAVLENTRLDFLRRNRDVARFDGRRRQRLVQDLDQGLHSWQKSNAKTLLERVDDGFRGHLTKASKTWPRGSQEHEFKKRYNAGRRELEHEFGKKMRYKSIRDLLGGPAGEVMLDLKPVWLMSPLAVSDVLPLDSEHFDTVIFDEASQIPLEEAVPALFRAPQAIVVGDEMQLPPTRFFTGSGAEESLVFEDEGEDVELDLSRHSFLNHAARHFPSTLLGWHYRSRSEALIQFSNATFYEGRLRTIPEPLRIVGEREEIRVSWPLDAEAGVQGAEALLARSLSYHALEGGVYERRRNQAEADYIAELVAALLEKETGHSLAVVAFSEAQQGEIEAALERLGARDRGFRRRYEAELDREEDGQFAGLLIRNLENIQGDERDVVIASVCYGPNARGKVKMHFGPINQGGGERRLNVAFSRARQHMAVVSSLEPERITNAYNDGARCLRDYLRYARACSIGDQEGTRRILREQDLGADPRQSTDRRHVIADELALCLEREGFDVARDVGESGLRCDLAVAEPGASHFRLGLLLDGRPEDLHRDLLEKEVMTPKLLEGFGWKILPVLSKDWIDQRDRVLEDIRQAMAN